MGKCIHAHTHTYMHTHTHTRTRTHIYIHTRTHTNTYKHTHKHTHKTHVPTHNLQLGTLVVAEQQTGKLNPSTLCTVTAAKELGQPITAVLMGEHTHEAAATLARSGISRVRSHVKLHRRLTRYSKVLGM
jgi:D-alanyl-D-alanine carboxypeptidase